MRYKQPQSITTWLPSSADVVDTIASFTQKKVKRKEALFVIKTSVCPLCNDGFVPWGSGEINDEFCCTLVLRLCDSRCDIVDMKAEQSFVLCFHHCYYETRLISMIRVFFKFKNICLFVVFLKINNTI